jgi:hypothetical protein
MTRSFFLLLLFALPCFAQAPGPSLPAASREATTSALPGDDTIRARLEACLLAGDLSCVVTQYLLLHGARDAPGWMRSFQNAFSVANRKSGECIKVAKAISEALRELGQRPQFLEIQVRGTQQVLGFDELADGKLVRNYQVSETGYHVAVKLGDKVIDAYTGPAGLTLQEYLKRLVTDSSATLTYDIIDTLSKGL